MALIEHNLYIEEVDKLLDVMTECPELLRTAQPYIDAAEWSKETGENVGLVVGLNSAGDMHEVVRELQVYVSNCGNCALSGTTECALSGTAEIKQPEQLLNFLEQIKV